MNESMLNAIKKLEKKYDFLSWYSLPNAIEELVFFHKRISELYLNTPSNKEFRRKLDNIIKLAEKMIVELNNAPEHLKDYMNVFLHGVLSVAKYPLDKIWNFANYASHSEIFLLGLKYTLLNFPHKKGGRKPIAVTQDVINFLIDIFEEGTGTKAECKHTGFNDQDNYSGVVYDFILDLEPILEKLGIENLGTDKSIGKFVILGLREKNKTLKNKLLILHDE